MTVYVLPAAGSHMAETPDADVADVADVYQGGKAAGAANDQSGFQRKKVPIEAGNTCKAHHEIFPDAYRILEVRDYPANKCNECEREDGACDTPNIPNRQ